MSSRERILAALRCQPVDRIPLTPLLGGYGIASLPQRYQEMTRWELYSELGFDLFIRGVARGFVTWPPESYLPPSTMVPAALLPAVMQKPPAKPRPDLNVELTNVRQGHETMVLIDTPVGSLRSLWRQTPQSPQLPFPAEHMLKTVEDVKVYQYVLEQTSVEPRFEDLVATQSALGDTGVTDASGHCAPVMDLAMFHMGLETFVFMLQDHPDETHALLDMMHEVRKKEYKALAQTSAEVIITYENTSTTLLSPSLMARYEFPALAEYSEIVHAAGKLHLAHMCGKVRGALDLIGESPLDGIIDVAPSPSGNLDFGAAREKLCGAGKSLCGGIDATAFAVLAPDEMEGYVLKRLRQTAPGTGFLLGSGDCVPNGTPLETLRAVSRAVQQYGAYPVQP